MTFWDKVINQNKIDSSLITELSDLSYKSIGGKRQPPRGANKDIVNIGTIPFQTTPAPDKITQDMIIDYQKNQDKPYIDPAGNEYKYFPSTFKFDVASLKQPPYVSVKVDKDIRPAKPQDIEDLKELGIRISDVIVPQKTEDWNQLKEELKTLKYVLTNGHPVMDSDGNVISHTALATTEATQYRTDIKEKEAKIAKIKQEIKDANDFLKQIPKHIEDFKKNIQENKDIELETARENKENIAKYEETLRLVNQNRMKFLQKEPNESDVDYLQRMNNIEAERYDTNLYQEKARLEQVVKLKLNLKNVIRKDDLIENVVKSFTGDQIFLINKQWAGIQEYFLETFGFNNANLTTNDVVNEITAILEKILNPLTAYEIEKEDTVTTAKNINPATSNTDFEFGTENNSFYIGDTVSNKHLWLKIGQKQSAKVVFFSTNLNQQGSFNQIRKQGNPREERISHLFFDYLKIDANIFTEVFEDKQDVSSLYDLLESKYSLQPITGIKSRVINSMTGSRRWGWGISHPDEELPTYAKFGNLTILLNKLFYKNILSLKTKTGHTIDGLKNTKVSDALVEVIMKMYYNENIDSLLKTLSNAEKHLLNSILYMAGLHKKFKSNPNETLEDLKERFKICEGEIISGNNNPEVLKELKDILLKLHHLNAISLQAIKKYLKQFN